MFIRKKPNKSGSVSVQIISKSNKRYKVIKTIGSSSNINEIETLVRSGYQEIERLESRQNLFATHDDVVVGSVIKSLTNASIRTVGPELIFGKIYDSIGFGSLQEDIFRHLVISRLAFPLSKLKTVNYLYRYQGLLIDVDTVYRFLDKLNSSLKSQVEIIAFADTKRILNGNISIVFYDMTTLYFEASDEDDLRKTGFSKDGKHSSPQIFIGLLVGLGGYAIGYDIFEGNIYEGHTLIPFLEKIRAKFDIEKPVVVADSGLLSSKNIALLKQMGYKYILGARLKNEPSAIKNQIISQNFSEGKAISIEKNGEDKLIVAYSTKRCKKDEHNRKRGLQRLEKRIKSGKLTKSNINNKGYNKYLKMKGEVLIEIDYDKYNIDKVWDGLKGYITNADLSEKEIIANYKNLWQIEKAFRMSKTDLRIRPIYHRLKQRIEAHICISFTAYCIYKELERVLYLENSKISIKTAAELTHNMYQINFTMPDSKEIVSTILNMDDLQSELYNIIQKYF